jgi:signal transduction histidine kinase
VPGRAVDLSIGVAMLVAGAAVVARRGRGAGAPMVITALAWLAGDVTDALLYVHRGPLVQLLLGYPTGRLRPRAVVAVTVAAYADGLVPVVARAPWPTLALVAVVMAAAGWRLIVAGRWERSALTLAFACAMAVCGSLAASAVTRIVGVDAEAVTAWAYEVAVCAGVISLASGLLWGHWATSAVSGLVLDLGAGSDPQALRAALARTVGDQTLRVAYRVGAGWVDELGRPVELPAGSATGRAVTVVQDAGRPVAAIVHDPTALADERLAESVAAVARLAVATAAMQAESAQRLKDVAASRRRLVVVADEERRRIGERLASGVQARLALLSRSLGGLAGQRDGETAVALGELREELDNARADLERFAEGVHPRTLDEEGIAAALTELAARAGAGIDVSALHAEGIAPAQAAAAFFVCSEGLANVAKHAPEARVDITARSVGGELVFTIGDNGPGGADPGSGSGLRGLSDRVGALGGTLRIASPRGGGTRLEARLPIDDVVPS